MGLAAGLDRLCPDLVANPAIDALPAHHAGAGAVVRQPGVACERAHFGALRGPAQARSLRDAVELPVHSHPDERVRTVISGTYYSAIGEVFDAQALQAFPVGTVSHVPVAVWQFAQTRDEATVIQIIGIGPTGIDYRTASEDPRQAQR
jgi:hypothetical protein